MKPRINEYSVCIKANSEIMEQLEREKQRDMKEEPYKNITLSESIRRCLVRGFRRDA